MPLDFNTLRIANSARQAEWDEGSVLSLSYLGNAAGGEMGEAQNVIKKIERELADVIIYVDLLARHVGVDLGEAVRSKFNATSEKYELTTRIRDYECQPDATRMANVSIFPVSRHGAANWQTQGSNCSRNHRIS